MRSRSVLFEGRTLGVTERDSGLVPEEGQNEEFHTRSMVVGTIGDS